MASCCKGMSISFEVLLEEEIGEDGCVDPIFTEQTDSVLFFHMKKELKIAFHQYPGESH